MFKSNKQIKLNKLIKPIKTSFVSNNSFT